MAVKKRGLGRGLDALLGVVDTAPAPKPANAGPQQLPVDLIQRGKYQPRNDMRKESLQDLADSISVQGILQPVVVRPVGQQGHFEIIAGERRWRAAQLAGLSEIPVIIRDVPDKDAISMALIENIQRENLNPVEEAVALERLIQEFDMTHQTAAEAVGRSRAAVSNLLRLLELNSDVKAALVEGKLEMGHARALLGLKGDAQSTAARQVISAGLSVRETEKRVRELLDPPKKRSKNSAEPDPNVRRLQQTLSETLGAKVTIATGARGRGKLTISYNSLTELDGILEHIK